MPISTLAKRAKTSRQTIYAIERGERKTISGQLMFRIADALDVDERDIFFTDDVTHDDQKSA
jgi:DNA-binding XRE family transcriptional regulator